MTTLPRTIVLRATSPAIAAELVRRAHLAKARNNFALAAPDRGTELTVMGYLDGEHQTIADDQGTTIGPLEPGDLFVLATSGPIVIGRTVRA